MILAFTKSELVNGVYNTITGDISTLISVGEPNCNCGYHYLNFTADDIKGLFPTDRKKDIITKVQYFSRFEDQIRVYYNLYEEGQGYDRIVDLNPKILLEYFYLMMEEILMIQEEHVKNLIMKIYVNL